MKVLRLVANNIMKLIAVDITPDGNLVMVSGKNDAGKSSVLNSIAMALGGADMCPPEPIHKGETEGKVRLDLGDLIVTRKFTRERGSCSCIPPGPLVNEEEIFAYQEACKDIPADQHQGNCGKHTFGDTKSTLIVTNREGARYPSPQAVLDRLFVNLTFDPLKFATDAKDDPKRAADVLRQLVKLDVTPFEKARTEAASKRAMLKKSHDIKAAQMLALPEYKDAGLVELSMDDVSKEMLLAEQYRKLAEEAEKDVDKKRMRMAELGHTINDNGEKIQALKDRIASMMSAQSALISERASVERDFEALAITAQSARAVVPDVDVIRQKLAKVEATNSKVRANHKRQEAEAEVNTLKAQINEQDVAVKVADSKKKSALEAVKFPVPGLGIDDNGVTFGGLPLSQASSSEQLRISTAVAIALNPHLKVLLIRNGNLLDDAHMAMLAKQAEEAGCQMWVELVTSNADGVSVFIEEGQVKP